MINLEKGERSLKYFWTARTESYTGSSAYSSGDSLTALISLNMTDVFLNKRTFCVDLLLEAHFSDPFSDISNDGDAIFINVIHYHLSGV